MCGICGLIDYKRKVDKEVVSAMTKAISYRGPDYEGIYCTNFSSVSIGLGHARLSIIDLSVSAHQPMQSGNLTIVFNGEIYNYKEIRNNLQTLGYNFNTESDTEVILLAFKEWGKKCVDKFIGMFAFAILDSHKGCLYLCRDRAGVKPLYYYYDGQAFMFASELKSFMAYDRFVTDISMEAFSMYFQLGYIPQSMCIFQNSHKLNAASWLEFNFSSREISIERYWNLADYYNLPRLTTTYEDAKEQLRSLFKSAFEYRMVADVPVGVFLSGGFDSAVVASILSKECNRKLKTFTIGFQEGVNEAPDAEAISRLLGTTHTTRYCDYKDAMELIPQLSYYYDEPLTDPSGIPTILVSKVAKEQVKVALSADGGDEIFGGYMEYVAQQQQVERYSMMSVLKIKLFQSLLYPIGKIVLPNNRHYTLEQVHGFLKEDEKDFKEWILHKYDHTALLAKKLNRNYSTVSLKQIMSESGMVAGMPEFMLLFDYQMRMKDQFLVKVDRATMSVSLEGREPMLDHRISEFVAQLPWEYKICDGVKKRILKDIVYDYLPKSLMDKPKRGFSLPLHIWMRNELKEYTCATLNKTTLLENGFNYKLVSMMLDAYIEKGYYFDWIWKIVQYLNWKKLWVR